MTHDTNSLSDEAARQQLYALMQQNLPRTQLLSRVLEIGSRYLDVEHGHIADIDQGENRWEVVGTTDGPDGPYPDGLTAALEDSYCRHTVKQETPVALHDAGAQGWADDRAYEKHGLDTYLGTRIDVLGHPFGTLCFVANDAREESFSEAEKIFVEFAAQILGQVLERSHHERELANRDRMIGVLNRVLRHNLRNDLNVIHGYAEILQQLTTGDAASLAATIESTATELLMLSEKARKSDRLTRSVPVARPTNVVPLVDAAVATVRDQCPAVDIAVSAPAEVVALAAPHLEDAIVELVDNAARYGGDGPGVEVAVAAEQDETTVAVSDSGPGLPPGEQRVLTDGNETPLEHGDGLGLFLVHWIVANLDGRIDVETKPKTRVAIRLPNIGSGATDQS
ncbi:GAF domain-containing sensor histidine kinase [Haloarchaeobius sp. TZWSO28]|uniref:GAF domain-containing sensor histidine kinase n=1 Tax=Haloarchaeobius sp. TZWSO28 TaxID=3446119 RepID=UPI003EBD451E